MAAGSSSPGPLSRIADFKFIETTQFGSNLQQVRYPPTRAAYTAALALSRMFMLPGAIYVDPDFSWRYEIGPAGTDLRQRQRTRAPNTTERSGLDRPVPSQQVGDNGGSLYRFDLTPDRLHVDVSADPAAGRPRGRQPLPSAEIRWHRERNAPDRQRVWHHAHIEQGPDGNLYVVSITDNAIYKISRKQ